MYDTFWWVEFKNISYIITSYSYRAPFSKKTEIVYPLSLRAFH